MLALSWYTKNHRHTIVFLSSYFSRLSMVRVATLSDLTKVSDRWTVVVRVLRKWTVYKKTNPAEGFCTSMILIDREVHYRYFLVILLMLSINLCC